MESKINNLHRESFLFYRSFFEAIEQVSETDQLQIYRAIAQFALDGVEPQLQGLLKALWIAIKPQLEANNKRYLNGCKGGVHGKRGGAPKGNANARKQPQNNPKTTPNDNDNDNVNERVCEVENNLHTHTHDREKESEDYRKFKTYLQENTPYIWQNMEIPTEEEFYKLKSCFTSAKIGETCKRIENRKDLRSKYNSLFRTLINWLDKENDCR